MSQKHYIVQAKSISVPSKAVNATSGSREAAPKVTHPAQRSTTPPSAKRAGDGEKKLHGTNPRINTTNKRK